MILDNFCKVWASAALTTDAASTYSYDTGAAGNDVSIGEPLAGLVNVEVAGDHTTGNETYEFQVIQSASADLSTPDILCKVSIVAGDVAALLAAGKFIVIPIPPGSVSKRYLGLYFDGGGTTPTITVSGYIVPLSFIQREKVYADAITIS